MPNFEFGFQQHTCYHVQIPMCSFLQLPAQKFKPKLPWELQSTTNCIQLFSTLITKTRACALQLQVCDSVETLNQVHAHILITGLDQDSFFGANLINKYAILGYVEEARHVFDEICQPNSFLWNTLIRGYARNGYFGSSLRLYYQMKKSGIRPDNFTFPFALKACGTLSTLQVGKEIHNHIIKYGFGWDAFVSASLVDMYTKCRELNDAYKVFDRISERDVVSWTAMIAGYAKNGHLNEAMTLFHQMQLEGFTPDLVTAMSVLSACAQVGALQQGKWIHNYIVKSGFESDVSVMNSLVDMYAKCREIEFACQLFERMSERDVVSWSAMISGCAKNGAANEALILFNRMHRAGIKPNLITMVSVLPACAQLEALLLGKWMHSYIIISGFESDFSVETALIDMYFKCGSVENACQVFRVISTKDAILWGAMIAGYTQNGNANETLTLFNQMLLDGVTADSATMVNVLKACAQLGALQQGKWIHDYIIRTGYQGNTYVETALVDMYAKCGSIEIAHQLFDKMSTRDVVSWSAMIAGYGMHGRGNDALAVFSKMQLTCIQPNDITFVSVLSACSHAGLVDEGWHYFRCMRRDYCIMPRAEHYACMVDLLGRSGNLDEAHAFILNMPIQPNTDVWGALLGACRIHCNVVLAECAAKYLFDLKPQNAGYYVLLSNTYAAVGRWDDALKVRTIMKEMGLKMTPGCSFIEVNNKVHAFLVEDITSSI